MAKDAVYLPLDVLSMLAVTRGFDVDLLRLYLSLSGSAEKSASAQHCVRIAKPERHLERLGARLDPGEDQWDALTSEVGRLESAGLAARVSDDEWTSMVKEKTSCSDAYTVRLLDPDGKPHRRAVPRYPRTMKYVRLLQRDLGELCALSDSELVLALLLMSAVRLPAFGGVDQGFVRVEDGKVTFGRVLREAYTACIKESRRYAHERVEPIGTVLERLTSKGYFGSADLRMSKVGRYGNTWLLMPSWEKPPNKAGESGTPTLRRVLIPQKALGLHAPDMTFINSLIRGELTEEGVGKGIITNLKGMVVNEQGAEFERYE